MRVDVDFLFRNGLREWRHYKTAALGTRTDSLLSIGAVHAAMVEKADLTIAYYEELILTTDVRYDPLLPTWTAALSLWSTILSLSPDC